VSGRRLFVPRERMAAGRARLAPADLHYLRDVLRLGPGAPVEVFDGAGGVHEGRLEGDDLLVGPRREAPPPAARVHLVLALARGERFDLVVQKATELGASRILPFEAARSVVRLDPARGAERQRRWQRIAAEAARQCGRADVPEVAPPGALVDRSAAGPGAVVGTEGGLAPEEVLACLAAGARLATLGPRILRFETAAIAAVALVQYLAGDMG